ncbi:hypothetical protein KHS38_12045 [Mucilaginibacter sp. Bleaf8]|uniref:hypothetical protein n=1 Tax=Mucilaginibacter sp. Bleaf8 TaxID=2834430 RepID=UPI001BCF10CF|nr:hypothetical protein [Mucilaginibacter sp. Bleaf8]MBS7565136.1 hypothetical protein [Mucilaginibacter sp. Bleaf8]
MSTQTLTGQKGEGLEPINYQAYITEYSWWTSRTGARKFVIVRIRHDFPDEACKTSTLPTHVVILEVGKTEPLTELWTKFVQLVVTGEMVKIN